LNAPESQQLDLFGQALAPAKPSVAPESKKASEIIATYGRSSFGSSASANLTESLASRLKLRLDTVGSTVYRQTWKRKTTPLGRLYWAHTARALTTKDSGYTGWPTPDTHKCGGQQDATKRRDGGHAVRLQDAVTMAGWPTPNAMEGGQTSRGGARKDEPLMGGVVKLVSWSTPRSTDQKCGNTYTENCNGSDLKKDAQLAAWCSPASRDHKDTPGMSTTGVNPDGSIRSRVDMLPRQAHMAETSGQTPSPSPAGTTASGVLNPAFSRWLQGFPVEWCQAAIIAYRAMRTKLARAVSCASKATETPST
jgi:hypothetical protein